MNYGSICVINDTENSEGEPIMEKNFHSDYYDDIKIITPNDGAHYFFAYYDMRATVDDKKHLCHRVPFMDRLPVADDVAQIGYVEDGKFTLIAETTAWNFQQGAMLQYHPYLPDTIYYNVVKDGNFCTVTHNYKTGEKKYTDRATACVSPDGKWGLSVNFGRIYAFRPGYGYAGFVDEYADVNAPEQDGVFLTDMETGKSKLLISYKELAPYAHFAPEDKILVNHITFNKTNDRYIMLVRNFPTPERKGWLTSMIVGDLEGNVRTVLPNTYISHYNWLDGEKILAHCTVEGDKKSLYEINVLTSEWVEYEYDVPYFNGQGGPDIHCSYSPDNKYVIGDGYPKNGHRYLFAYNVKTGKLITLLSVLTNSPAIGDIRCDLHARFVFGGKYISFDTLHNGKREIALISADTLNF